MLPPVVLARRPAIPVERVLEFLTTLFGEALHAKRILSMAHATVGVVAAGVLGISAIGKGMAVTWYGNLDPRR